MNTSIVCLDSCALSLDGPNKPTHIKAGSSVNERLTTNKVLFEIASSRQIQRFFPLCFTCAQLHTGTRLGFATVMFYVLVPGEIKFYGTEKNFILQQWIYGMNIGDQNSLFFVVLNTSDI